MQVGRDSVVHIEFAFPPNISDVDTYAASLVLLIRRNWEGNCSLEPKIVLVFRRFLLTTALYRSYYVRSFWESVLNARTHTTWEGPPRKSQIATSQLATELVDAQVASLCI